MNAESKTFRLVYYYYINEGILSWYSQDGSILFVMSNANNQVHNLSAYRILS